jgi:hypothetical protein
VESIIIQENPEEVKDKEEEQVEESKDDPYNTEFWRDMDDY